MKDTRENVNADRAGPSIAALTNVTLMAELIDLVMNRPAHLPGFGVLFGPSGFGKSTAAAAGANMYNAAVVEMRSTYTAKYLMEKIATEVGVDASGTTSKILDRVAQQMAVSGHALIIDECDYLVKNRKIEVIRDLHEASQGAIILIGEERFPKELERWERVHNRVLEFVQAQPMGMDDIEQLAELYCPRATLTAELLAKLHKESGPSARRVSVNLHYLRERAATLGKAELGIEDLDIVSFTAGRSPTMRHF